MGSKSVFDVYAHEYDIITNARAREKFHAKEVRALIDKFSPKSVLDAGCALGLTAALFARHGVDALGIDRSRRMITEAKKKYAATALPLSFRFGRFEKLPKVMTGRFDMVVCLANAISGVGSKANLQKSIRSFLRVLKPGGTLVLQALNYASLTDGEVRPIKASQQGKIGYLRYAVRHGSRLQVAVIRLDLSKSPFEFEPFVHEFDNFTPTQLVDAARRAGASRISRYGDLCLSRRFGKKSRDIVLTIQKPAN